jgi:hypothetical protein
MPKSSFTAFDVSAYATVAERLRLFWQAYPNGRIATRLVSRTTQDVVFEARVYRSADDPEPAATGWAAEREGDGDINVAACLENTETSAVGRALANLGFTASKARPSLEEMQKAVRAQARQAGMARDLQREADAVTDVLDLLTSARRLGLSVTRERLLRRSVMNGIPDQARVKRTATVLQRWIAHRVAVRFRTLERPRVDVPHY